MSRTKIVRVAGIVLAATMGFVVAGWVVAQDTAPKAAPAAPAAEAKATEAKPTDAKPAETKATDAKAEEAKPAGEAIAWVTDLAKAKEAAKAGNKLVFVDFRADWCPPCRMLDKQTFSDAKVAAALGEMIAVKVDCDTNQELMKEYKVGGIPALFVLGSDGQILARATGFRPADKFLDFLAFAKAKQAATKDPKDAAAALQTAVLSEAADVSMEDRIQLATTALALNEKAPNDAKAKLMVVRALGKMDDPAAAEDAKKDLDEAVKLDAENAAGAKEQAEWYLTMIEARKSGNPSDGVAAAQKYLDSHPQAKMKDKNLRGFILANIIYRSHRESGDLKAALADLEAIKADHKEIFGEDVINDQIAQVKEAMAAEAKKAEEPKKVEEPKKTEEPAKGEEPKKAVESK